VKGFLFDENVPTPLRFVPSLPVIHATSLVATLGPSPSDRELWTHAAQNALVIVSKDTDFADRVMDARSPPWVVHLRFGNLRRAAFETLLASAWPRVESLLPAHKLIRVFADRIESIRD
jgi:predicted nuclease of predicted toxin-antitoxin system